MIKGYSCLYTQELYMVVFRVPHRLLGFEPVLAECKESTLLYNLLVLISVILFDVKFILFHANYLYINFLKSTT